MDIQSDFIPLDNRHKRKISFEEKDIETIFSDNEAFSICSGLKSSQARQVWKRQQQGKHLNSDTFAAHIYAMEVFKKYGAETVSFLLAIPPLPVGGIFTDKAFALFDKLLPTKDNPIIRLVDKHQIHYSIGFSYDTVIDIQQIIHEGSNHNSSWRYIENKKIKNRKYDYNVLVLQKDGIPVVKVYRDGKVCPINDASTNQPVIELLINFCANPLTQILHYGAVTSHCSNCGIPISNPRSIRATVGKDCARNLGIPWA